VDLALSRNEQDFSKALRPDSGIQAIPKQRDQAFRQAVLGLRDVA
jgi:hypothetical protein